MRARGIDYFENSRRATLAQQRYAMRNRRGCAGYGELCWGLTASEGPEPVTKTIGGIQRQFFDYVARGIPYGLDDGTLAPWAVVASLPFAPEIVVPTIRSIAAMGVGKNGPYGFSSWSVDYGVGAASPLSYTVLATGTSPVGGATLATWATLPLANGLYTLRLRAWDKAGNVGTVQIKPTIGSFKVALSADQLNVASAGMLGFEKRRLTVQTVMGPGRASVTYCHRQNEHP